MHTARDVAKADLARQLYQLVGRPSEAFFLRILRNRSILNCPITPLDAKRAFTICRPDVATLKGKTTRGSPPARVPAYAPIALLPHVLTNFFDVVLCLHFSSYRGTFSCTPSPVTYSSVLSAQSPTVSTPPSCVKSPPSSRCTPVEVSTSSISTLTMTLTASTLPFTPFTFTRSPPTLTLAKLSALSVPSGNVCVLASMASLFAGFPSS